MSFMKTSYLKTPNRVVEVSGCYPWK